MKKIIITLFPISLLTNTTFAQAATVKGKKE
jgi:hypothetical protein